MNAPIAPPQQQQRPFTQYAAYSQYPNGPFRGNLGRNGNSGNRNGKNDPDYKWDQPFLKDFMETPRSWTKIDKQVGKMFTDVTKATQFKALLRESGAKGVANMIDKFNFYGKASERSDDGDVSTMQLYGKEIKEIIFLTKMDVENRLGAAVKEMSAVHRSVWWPIVCQ